MHLFRRSSKRKNILLLGASGGVANAFLHTFVHHRDSINNLILLDRSTEVLDDPYIDHQALNYQFIQKDLILPEKQDEYIEILKKHQIDIVLDLTDIDAVPLVEATDKAGVNYINTAMSDEKYTVYESFQQLWPIRDTLHHAVHIMCSGMNPGVVNMWVRYGIEKFGKPKEVIHFEYDTSTPAEGWKSMMTWSVPEFIVECVRDPSGKMMGRDKLEKILPNALMNRVEMKDILSPIMALNKYPRGFQVLHEENISIAHKYDIPAQFVYAVNMTTMEHLVEIYKKKGNIVHTDLIQGQNTNLPLEGADQIGVILEYDDKKVYYFNPSPNVPVIGTNGTYSQVIVGVYAALITLLFDHLDKGVYFVEDLFDNMRVSEFVFHKGEHGLKLKSHNPKITLKRKNKFEHFFI